MPCRVVGFLVITGLLAVHPAAAELAEDARALKQQGIALHDDGKYEEAIATYRRALELAPGDPGLIFEISLSLQGAGRFQECARNAERHLKKAGRLEVDYYSLIASCRDLGGDPKGAAKLFDKGLKKFPDNVNLLLNAGVTRLRLDEPAKAKELLKRAAALDPAHASTHYFLAVAFEHSGFRVPALLAHIRFLALSPESGKTYDSAISVLRLLGRGVEKKNESEITILVDPEASKEEGDYAVSELTLGLAVAAGESGESKELTATEKISEQIRALISVTSEDSPAGKSDFARAHYLPFASELNTAGQVPAFVSLCFAQVDLAGAKEWAAAHPDEMRALAEFLRAHGHP